MKKIYRAICAAAGAAAGLLVAAGQDQAVADYWAFVPGQQSVEYRADRPINLHMGSLDRQTTSGRAAATLWSITIEFSSRYRVTRLTQVAFADHPQARNGGWVVYDHSLNKCRIAYCDGDVARSNRVTARIAFTPMASLQRAARYKYLVFRLRLANGNVSYYTLSTNRLGSSARSLQRSYDQPTARSETKSNKTAAMDKFFSGGQIAPVRTRKSAAAFPRIGVRIKDQVKMDDDLRPFILGLYLNAQKRNLAGITSKVGPAFFWDRDHGGMFIKRAPPRDNLVNALGIGPNTGPEYIGAKWRDVRHKLGAAFLSKRSPGSDTVCMPGRAAATGRGQGARLAGKINSEMSNEWYFVYGSPVKIHERPSNRSAVVGTAKDEFLRMRNANNDDGSRSWVPVQLHSGLTGYAERMRLYSPHESRLCFAYVSPHGMRIVGYSGGGD
jgi:hypothetical protein